MKTQKNYDLSKIIKKEHEGKWIALSPAYTKVLGSSASLVELTKKIGKKEVVYMKAPIRDVYYAF